MRKQRIYWTILVFGIVAAAYGISTLFYHLNHGKGLNLLSLVLSIAGVISLVTIGVLYLVSPPPKEEETTPPPTIEMETPKVETTPKEEKDRKSSRAHYMPYETSSDRSDSSSSSYTSTIYVSRVGYGPVLRIEANRIYDMSKGVYYSIDGNRVSEDGYGLRYEINGNQIRDAYGGYLYEISGSNINKTYGGNIAYISGNYITSYDSSIKLDISGSLSNKQILVVVALLFEYGK